LTLAGYISTEWITRRVKGGEPLARTYSPKWIISIKYLTVKVKTVEVLK